MSRLQTHLRWLRSWWWLPADLVAVVALVILTDTVVLLQAVNESPVRAVAGLAFVLFVPGYALVAALFPERKRAPTSGEGDGTGSAADRFMELVRDGETRGITGFERVALSFVLSLALVPLLMVGLTFLPLELALIPVFLTISAVTVACAGVAARRRRKLPVDRRFRVPYRAWIVAGKKSVLDADSHFDALLNFALAVAIVLAVGSLTFAIVAPPDGERFTEFYLLTENGEGELVAANYPGALSTDQPRMVHIGIENYEQESVEYTVVIQLQRLEGDVNESVIADRAEMDRFSTTLGHNETSIREQALTVADGPTGERLRLLFLLYIGDVPETPTRDNAYRNLHLWVEWEGGSPEVDETEPRHTAPTG